MIDACDGVERASARCITESAHAGTDEDVPHGEVQTDRRSKHGRRVPSKVVPPSSPFCQDACRRKACFNSVVRGACAHLRALVNTNWDIDANVGVNAFEGRFEETNDVHGACRQPASSHRLT